MIGLAGLQDGGHVLEHPAGPLYVRVKAGKIAGAELAPWGSPLVITWRRGELTTQLERTVDWVRLHAQGGDAAG